MKKGILFTLAVLMGFTSVFSADITFNIFKSNHSVQRYALFNIDSISINESSKQLLVYKKDGSIASVFMTEIDSMNYSSGDYSLPSVELISSDYKLSLGKGICEVSVTDNGGSEIHDQGICWSTSNVPTIKDNIYSSKYTSGKFYALMDDLTVGTTYYIRAYASNCMGITYSDAVEFKTLSGNVTYNLAVDKDVYPEYYSLLKTAFDSACYFYNRYTSFEANIYVSYRSGVPTAQAGYHGSIEFGSNTTYMWVGTVMHEMAHYFGSGTTSEWKSLMVGGVWQGSKAQPLCQELTGTTLKGDNSTSAVHYWPTGINYKSEVGSVTDLINHAKIVQVMIVEDSGLPSSW